MGTQCWPSTAINPHAKIQSLVAVRMGSARINITTTVCAQMVAKGNFVSMDRRRCMCMEMCTENDAISVPRPHPQKNK